MPTIRNELKKARLEAGLSQAKLAELVSVERTTYNKIERGQIKHVPVELAIKISRAVRKSVEQIFLSGDVHGKHNNDALKTG